MIDLLAGVLKIRTRESMTGFRKLPTNERNAQVIFIDAERLRLDISG